MFPIQEDTDFAAHLVREVTIGDQCYYVDITYTTWQSSAFWIR